MSHLTHALRNTALALAATLSVSAWAQTPNFHLHNTSAAAVINDTLAEGYWADANISSYKSETYDEIRLKSIESGYVPMITGEGLEDFDPDVVEHIVFRRLTELPKHMEGAKAVIALGAGYDPVVGAAYQDTFYVVDLTLLYVTFPQRTYLVKDPEHQRSYLVFEKIRPDMVDASTWTAYDAAMTKAVESVELRWAFGSVVPATEVFGMYVIEPGKEKKTRITLVSKLVFGDDTSWIARMGNQMPSVLRAGLRNGFDACVAIARDEKAHSRK